MGCISWGWSERAGRRVPSQIFLICGTALILGSFCTIAFAQNLLQSGPGGRVVTFGADQAILDAKEPRKDIPCIVTPEKPELGFDLKFHTGYEVSIPMKELNGGEDVLTMIFRVTPEAHPDDPLFFTEKIMVPKLDENAGGHAYLAGSFITGEGVYQVDWLMRDRSERVCSSYWSTTAALTAKEKMVQMAIRANTAEATDPEPFREEPPVARDAHNGLNVKVLVNFAPQRFLAASLQPIDTAALVSILRNISREPRIGKFSLVAFNMQEQRSSTARSRVIRSTSPPSATASVH